MNETIQRTVQLLIDAGAAKAGAEQFRQAAETIERSAREAAAAGQPITNNAARIERQFNSLKMSIDPLHAAQVRLAQGLQVLENRFKQGNYPIEEMQADIALLTQRYDRAAQSAQRFGGVAGAASGGFRSIGTAIQQAGYQVGDFAVQVASGQGVLRPFIQQGTQLISGFGMWGAVIGAAGAVVGALATNVLGLGEASDAAAAAQESHNKSMSEASRLMDELYGKSERNRQSLEAEVRNRVGVAESELAAAERALAQADDRLRAVPGAGGNRFDLNIAARNSAQNEVEAAREIVRLRTQELNLLKAQLGYFSDGRSRMGQDNSGSYYKSAAAGARDLAAATSEATDETKALLAAVAKADAAGVAEFERLMDQLGNAVDQADKAGVAEWQRTMDEGKRIMESVRTPAEAYLATVQRLNELHADGAIDWTTYYRAVARAQDQLQETNKTAEFLAQTGEQAFDRIGAAATEMAMNGKKAFKDFGSTANAVLSEVYQAFFRLAFVNPMKNWALGEDNPILSDVIGSLFDGISGWFSSPGSGSNNWGSGPGQTQPRYSFAGGGVMTPEGPVPLHRYARGGIANSPQLAMFGEGDMSEAYVPLPDGRSIPVTISIPSWATQSTSSARSDASGTIVNIIDQRSAQNSEPVETRRRRGPGGLEQVDIILKDRMDRMIQRGAFDNSLSSRYDLIERPVERRG